MSHSDNLNQKYLDLYKLRQSAIANTLHSDLAQPIVAAKNFASAILNIQGDDANLQEARELAGVILEMTDQAYTVAYDLMRENESGLADDSHESMQSTINSYGKLLRFERRGIELRVIEDLSSISMDGLLQVVVLDWTRSLLIYLARHTKMSVVTVRLIANDLGFDLEVTPNVVLSSDQLDTELVMINIRKQLEVFAGTLFVDVGANETTMRVCIPAAGEIIKVIK